VLKPVLEMQKLSAGMKTLVWLHIWYCALNTLFRKFVTF